MLMKMLIEVATVLLIVMMIVVISQNANWDTELSVIQHNCCQRLF